MQAHGLVNRAYKSLTFPANKSLTESLTFPANKSLTWQSLIKSLIRIGYYTLQK